MPRLFIRVLDEAQILADEEGYAIDVEWLVREDNGEVRDCGVTDYRGLADLADPNVDWLSDPASTIMLVPSQFVLNVNCEVPGRNVAQIRRALPFAVEEFVASDIETMHIAHAPIRAGQPVACSLIEAQVLETWLACLASISVTPSVVIADAQVLAQQNQTASVLFEERGVLIADQSQAATVDRDTVVFALNALQTETIVLINGQLTDLELGQLDVKPTVQEVALSEHGALDYLSTRFDHASYINLRQGEYAPPKRHNPELARWRSVGLLAAVWLVLGFILLMGQAWWSSSEADRLEAETLAYYKRLFPTERNQPNSVDQLRRRVLSKLNTGRSTSADSDFVGLVAHFAQAISQQDRVVSLSYSQQRAEVTVEVMLATYDDLEQIKNKLAGSGVSVVVANAEQEGEKVRSRLRVSYLS